MTPATMDRMIRDAMRAGDESVARAAREVHALGPVLKCALRCGATRSPSAAEVERFLRAGWPTCHGRGMLLETLRRHVTLDDLPGGK